MNLSKLKDHEVLAAIKTLVQNERDVLTTILHHLREVETRRLFCDLKYSSLFDYAVNELKYSEAQAGRRISAMRLLRELPQVEEKIQSGSLNLSNLCQARSYFREVDKKAETEGCAALTAEYKTEILEQLENKSARDGERLLSSLKPELSLPKDKERFLTETHSEVRFVMDDELRNNLEQVRSLLGIKGLGMSFKELANEMALLSITALSQKAFGKKRVNASDTSKAAKSHATAEPMLELTNRARLSKSLSTSKVNRTENRHISKALKFKIWQRDEGQCTNCSSKANLNIDHIKPAALGGENTIENLRLLCFHCNQRRALKTFGTRPQLN